MRFHEFARDLRGAWPGRRGLVVLRTPESTHRLGRTAARDYADDGATPPSADLIAWSQMGGTGRLERPWHSPPGGLYVTLVRPAPALPVQLLPLAAAVLLGDEVDRLLSAGAVRCRLKWPNDLVIDGRKVGGLLIDVNSARRRAQLPAIVVLSFGLNVAGDPSAFDAALESGRATTLSAHGVETPASRLCWRLITALDRLFDGNFDGDAVGEDVVDQDAVDENDLLARYRRLSLHQDGDRLVVHGADGSVAGRFRGFTAGGFLRLEVDGTERLVAAGEIDLPSPDAEDEA